MSAHLHSRADRSGGGETHTVWMVRAPEPKVRPQCQDREQVSEMERGAGQSFVEVREQSRTCGLEEKFYLRRRENAVSRRLYSCGRDVTEAAHHDRKRTTGASCKCERSWRFVQDAICIFRGPVRGARLSSNRKSTKRKVQRRFSLSRVASTSACRRANDVQLGSKRQKGAVMLLHGAR